jgi:2'-5' RNA ligase
VAGATGTDGETATASTAYMCKKNSTVILYSIGSEWHAFLVLQGAVMPQRHDIYYMLRPTPDAAAHAAALWMTLRVHSTLVRSFPMPPERLHITLLSLGSFEGSVPDTLLHLARVSGAAVDDEPFHIVLDRLRSRGGGSMGTVELGGDGTVLRKLYRLQRDLRQRVIRAGFPAGELRTSFTPHMTLDYKHPRRVAPCLLETPISWRVTELCLVDSLYGLGRHEVLDCWPLKQRQQVFSGWEPDAPMDGLLSLTSCDT